VPDDQTLAFYATHAAQYARDTDPLPSPRLRTFLARLPPGGSVLELGTGSGADAAAIIQEGFAVLPTDGSPELATQAEARLGRAVKLMAFHQLEDEACYDGIWANACLLHAPRSELADDFRRIFRALKPGGWLAASFKAGEGEGRDQWGRYYNYLSETELAELVRSSGRWNEVEIQSGMGSGYDRRPTRWLWLCARRGS
jgi:SAM-dependent methyltransferase